MLAAGRFAFINVWRGINETPIYRKPLAMADTRTVPTEDFFTVLRVRVPRRITSPC